MILTVKLLEALAVSIRGLAEAEVERDSYKQEADRWLDAATDYLQDRDFFKEIIDSLILAAETDDEVLREETINAYRDRLESVEGEESTGEGENSSWDDTPSLGPNAEEEGDGPRSAPGGIDGSLVSDADCDF